MIKAINSKTKQVVSSLLIEFDPSYINVKEDTWYAIPSTIIDKGLAEDINKIEVGFKKGFLRERNNKKEFVSPHFFILNKKKLNIFTEKVSKEHVMAQNLIYSLLKNKEEIYLIFSKVSKPNVYENKISLNEIEIDYDKINLEVNVDGKIADLLIPFKNYHELFGFGINIEVQFSHQSESNTIIRTNNWALRGYSICWLWPKDFTIDKDFVILNNKELKVKTMVNILREIRTNEFNEVTLKLKQFSQEIDKKLSQLGQSRIDIIDIHNDIKRLRGKFSDDIDYGISRLNETGKDWIKTMNSKETNMVNTIKSSLQELIEEKNKSIQEQQQKIKEMVEDCNKVTFRNIEIIEELKKLKQEKEGETNGILRGMQDTRKED